MVDWQNYLPKTKTHMGTNQGDIPEAYLETAKTPDADVAGKQVRVVPNTTLNNTQSAMFSEEGALPDFKSISPSSFFELKREFLKLSESYIARFIAKLDAMRDAYENDDSERKARDLFASKKLGNSIGYEQYLYYSSLLKPTNLIYRERIASAVFDSKDTLDLFYFQVHFAYNQLRKSKEAVVLTEVEWGEEVHTIKKNSPYSKILKVLEKLRETPEYTALSDAERHSLDVIIGKQILFGLRIHNPEAFNNGLQSILFIYFRTKNDIFLDLYEKIKQSFWIVKNDFVDFLGENKEFLLWIHIMLDANKLAGERSQKDREGFMEDIKALSPTQSIWGESIERMKRNLRTLIQDRQTPHSFRMDKKILHTRYFHFLAKKMNQLWRVL